MYRRSLIASAAIALSCVANLGAAAPLRLTQDINPGAGSGVNSFSYFAATDYLLFWGFDGSNGTKGNPYRSNGTTSGTGLIKVISGSTAANFPGPMVEVNDVQLFGFNDGLTSGQLWRTDGTSVGTSRLTTFAANNDPKNFMPMGNTLFFTSSSNCTLGGVQCVWSTDATAAASIAMVNSNVNDFPRPTVVMQRFVFSGRPINGGPFGLFVSNGTEGGSTLLTSTTLGSEIVAVNDKAYFVASDATNGAELWVTGLTGATTHVVTDINPGIADSSPQHLTRVGDLVFFTASDPTAGRELWRSDGTPGGTMRVADIGPGLLDAGIQFIDRFKSAQGSPKAFFFANDGTHGLEPWISDGTPAGTFPLGDLVPGSTGSSYTGGSFEVVAGTELFFPANDSSGGRIWATDGTVLGTKIVDTSIAFGTPTPATATEGHLFVDGFTSALGEELYQMDLLSYESLPPHGSLWCTRPEKTILDVNTITSRVRLPNHGAITGLDFVTLDLGHTFVGDLKITLTHEETGTQTTLLDRPKTSGAVNCSGDLIDISLSDSAATAVNTSCSANRNAYTPGGIYHPLQALSVFQGESVKGHWTLTTIDNAGGDSGTLHQWCMGFQHDYIFADDLE
jgi:ELWxxDGT repeat protein